jgi:hypothetical protein
MIDHRAVEMAPLLGIVEANRWKMALIVPNLVLAIERTEVHIVFAQVRVRIHREP